MTTISEYTPSYADVEQAATRIEGHIVKTPLLESLLLNQLMGGRILIKPEVLQTTGSFKRRGALNKILSLIETEKPKKIIAFSSGNHAQAVAAAAQQFSIPVTIIMPSSAPKIKINNTRSYGAEVIFYNPSTDDREQIANDLLAEAGSVLVRPYDDPAIISGQGTVGYEIAQQTQELGISDYAVAVPCGGGGLVSGVALAIKQHQPEVPIWAVEPNDFNDTQRSLSSGERVPNNSRNKRSICDSLLTPIPGEITFNINAAHLTGVACVSDEEVKAAIKCAFEAFKLVVEPGGAAALAAVLSGHIAVKDRAVVVILSGGGTDIDFYSDILKSPSVDS